MVYEFKNSFKPLLADLVTTLENDPDLQGFAVQEFKKKITVKRIFIELDKITSNMYPLIMITRPGGSSNGFSGATNKNKDHVIKLYCGFKLGDSQDTPREYIDLQIALEEYIELAILKDPSRGGGAVNTKVGNFRTDEGRDPPQYFLEKEITITQSVDQQNR